MSDAPFGVGIRAIGRYVPERVVTNDELAARLPTTSEWISERIGIETRRVAASDEWSSDLGAYALTDACGQTGITPDQVDLVICGTYTPDLMLPSTAVAIMRKAGVDGGAGFDVNSGGCPGAVFALDVGRRYVQSGEYARVAVVLTDVSSKLFDPEDRTVGVIFGDAAACYLLERTQAGRGISRVTLRSEPAGYWSAYVAREARAGADGRPKTSAFGQNFTTMEGGEIRDFVLGPLPKFIESFVRDQGLEIADIDFFALHQANLRLVHGVLDTLGVPLSKTLTNIERIGNTSGASLPLVLREAMDTGRLRSGQRAVLVAFGSGLNYGAALVDWSGPADFT
ncbi:ketoacyl-ACP synthase III [Nonomuraea sp. K274]|uniref:Ketoacyl-ACP synthase III n=1 Tax=Nonomuraea cypriaca TaxID=1187855 RepID=A0A931AI79_9ACTN|nr:ketoacyl-ACP synthase III [Nonomuraea cypriaca]MBF8193321.1 ketoacyl-ACP synthase III [Nonomuraea cypriaca]